MTNEETKKKLEEMQNQLAVFCKKNDINLFLLSNIGKDHYFISNGNIRTYSLLLLDTFDNVPFFRILVSTVLERYDRKHQKK